jgi:hypothetical protein
VQLTEQLVAFLNGPTVIMMGTRSAQLMPASCEVLGARVHADRERVDLYIREVSAEPHLRNLQQNGRVAVCFSAKSHETYQLKGEFEGVRPCAEEDYAIQAIWFTKSFSPEKLGPMYDLVAQRLPLMVKGPSVAVMVRVREVFNQTPGPGTGSRLELQKGEA